MKFSNPLTAVFVLVFTSLIAASANAAPITRIECPDNAIAYGATAPLSDGWVASTAVFRLTDLVVETIRGRQELTCKYGTHARVTRYGPDGLTCSVVDGGFTCSSERVVEDRVRSERIILASSFMIDLDRMITGGADLGRTPDLWFNSVSSSERYIRPMNGAAFRVGLGSAPGQSGCSTGTFTGAQVSISHFRPGTYGCVLTTEGRMVEYKVRRARSGPPYQIEFDFKLYP